MAYYCSMVSTSCDQSSCFLCTYCIPDWKEVIAIRKKTLAFKKGQTIFRQGEEVKGIFFVYSGSAKVHMPWGDQKELILRFAGAGDILGHRGLGSEEPYPITATAMEDMKVCFISNEFLEASLAVNPAFTYRLLQFYALELQRTEKRMRNMVHMEVKGRIAGALLDIAAFFGPDAGKYIAMPIPRQDIASYAGTTYETVFKFFAELTEAAILSTQGKRIRIEQPEKLQQYMFPPKTGN